MVLNVNPVNVVWFVIVVTGLWYAVRVSFRAIETWLDVDALEPGSLRYIVAKAVARRSAIRVGILTIDLVLGFLSLLTPPPVVKQVSIFDTIVAIGLVLVVVLVTIDAYLDDRYQRRVIGYNRS